MWHSGRIAESRVILPVTDSTDDALGYQRTARGKKMTTFSGSPATTGSAKIYTFPPRGRFALANQHDAMESASVKSAHAVKLASGSGWYHDAAIEDAREDVSRADWGKK
jgi:hypothetical protein